MRPGDVRWSYEWKSMVPEREELPPGWDRQGIFFWHRNVWRREGGPNNTGGRFRVCEVYLHDPGCPFLRFKVYHPNAKAKLVCQRCHGKGWRERPPIKPVFNIMGEDWDEVEEESGLRRCFSCIGRGWVEPRYGHGDFQQRLPGFDHSHSFAPPKTREDILYVLNWCNDLYDRLNRPQDELEQLGQAYELWGPELLHVFGKERETDD